MVVLSDVDPSVVFTPFGEAALAEEVVGEAGAPEGDHAEHDHLPGGDGAVGALLLVVEVEGAVDDGQDGPQPVDPGVLSSGDVEHEADGADDQANHHAVVDCGGFAAVGVGEG